VADEVERIMSLDPAGYRAEAELVRQHVQPHQIDASMKRFLQLVREADVPRHSRILQLTNYALWLVRRGINRRSATEVVPHPPAPLFGAAGFPGVAVSRGAQTT
jgi:hypothetical protein